MSDKEMLMLLKKFTDAWNAQDIEALMECMTPNNCVYYAHIGTDEKGTAFVGPEQVREAFEGIWQEIPDAKWNNPVHMVSGNRGFSESLFTGNSVDGKENFDGYGVDVFEFEDGKIKVKHSYVKQRVG